MADWLAGWLIRELLVNIVRANTHTHKQTHSKANRMEESENIIGPASSFTFAR